MSWKSSSYDYHQYHQYHIIILHQVNSRLESQHVHVGQPLQVINNDYDDDDGVDDIDDYHQ